MVRVQRFLSSAHAQPHISTIIKDSEDQPKFIWRWVIQDEMR